MFIEFLFINTNFDKKFNGDKMLFTDLAQIKSQRKAEDLNDSSRIKIKSL